MQRCNSFVSGLAAVTLVLASGIAALGDEAREIAPETASENAEDFENFPPGREADSVRVLGQDVDGVYATANAGEMPNHNEMIRYIRSAHANAAEIEEATAVEEVFLVDVAPLFEGEEGEALNGVVIDHAERVSELQKALGKNEVTRGVLAENNVSAADVVAVQFEASGVLTAYVR